MLLRRLQNLDAIASDTRARNSLQEHGEEQEHFARRTSARRVIPALVLELEH